MTGSRSTGNAKGVAPIAIGIKRSIRIFCTIDAVLSFADLSAFSVIENNIDRFVPEFF